MHRIVARFSTRQGQWAGLLLLFLTLAVFAGTSLTMERNRLLAEGRTAIAQSVTPAYGKLLNFIRDEYTPRARTTLAAEAMPDGKAYYRQQIRQYTTLDLGPDEVHRIGLDEVARIEGEMRKIMAEVGFTGSIADFSDKLRADPRFIAATPDELMGVSSYVAKRVDGRLADYFGFLPRRRFAIRPVADAIAPRLQQLMRDRATSLGTSQTLLQARPRQIVGRQYGGHGQLRKLRPHQAAEIRGYDKHRLGSSAPSSGAKRHLLPQEKGTRKASLCDAPFSGQPRR